MSSKTLVLTVVVLWSALCCYRYVCGIKQMCGAAPPAAAHQAIQFEAESLNAEQEPTNSQPAFTPSEPDTAAAAPANTAPPAEPDINRVQVEELADHVLIHFPYNSTRKEEDAAIDDYLSRLARQLIDGGGTVTLTGHTDNVGDSKTNEAFALRRAKNIRDLLIKKGVAKKQIVCTSYGERKPVATNDNPKGRYQNRRVEIRVK